LIAFAVLRLKRGLRPIAGAHERPLFGRSISLLGRR
jgi:hypothetical protein